MLSPELGNLLSTIVLSSAVLYELVGPALAKLSLHLAGALQPAAQTASGGDRADGAAGDVPSDDALNAAPAGADKARP